MVRSIGIEEADQHSYLTHQSSFGDIRCVRSVILRVISIFGEAVFRIEVASAKLIGSRIHSTNDPVLAWHYVDYDGLVTREHSRLGDEFLR